MSELLFRTLASLRYHKARGRFLDWVRKGFDFLVVLAGASATSTLIGGDVTLTGFLSLTTAVIGALQLLLGLQVAKAQLLQ